MSRNIGNGGAYAAGGTASGNKKSSALVYGFLIALAILQICTIIILSVLLKDSKSRVLSYFKDEDYNAAIELIESKDHLSDDDDVIDEAYGAADYYKEQYIADEISYDDAVSSINRYSSALGDKDGRFKDAGDDVKAVRDSRAAEVKGDKLFSENDYIGAFSEYQKMSSLDTAHYSSRSEKLGKIDEGYRSYLDGLAGAGNYYDAFDSIDSALGVISENPDYFDEGDYRDFCVSYGIMAIDACKKNGAYSGDDGALKISERVAALDGTAVNRQDIIDDYCAYMCDRMADRVNEIREEKGFSPLKRDSSIDYTSRYMLEYGDLDKMNGNSEEIKKYFVYTNVDYKYVYCTWNKSKGEQYLTGDAFSDKDNSNEFLNYSDYNKIGVGVIYHDETDSFDYMVSGIIK